MNRHIPIAGERYRHFKGNEYSIVCIAKSAATLESMVVYQALYGNKDIYARGLEEFLSPVDRDKYPGADQDERFALIGDESESNSLLSEEEVDITQGGSETQPDEEAIPLNPLVIQFLDASGAKERLLILESLEKVAKEYDVSIMLSALEMHVDDKLNVAQKLAQIRQSLTLHLRYETDRLR